MAGMADYALERAGIDRKINSDLALRTQAFFALASDNDPATDEPWASAEELMRAAISQVIVSATESAVGHVDGIPRFVPGGETHLRLEDDPAFMETARITASADVVVRSARSDLREYRYVSVPLVDEEGMVLATFTIATDRSALIADLNRTFRAFAVAGIGALLIVGAIGWISVGRLLRPIRLLDQTTREISETDLTQRIPIIGDDDLARLSETVNAMLDRLEEAFAAQRRLLDDAGHELRTPLAVMRTSLELLEPRDEKQVAETQAVLLDEVAMMSRLVDDLVVLAQADRPEFVRPKPVSLGEFTDSAFARAQTLGDRDWSLEARGEGTFCGDAQRLTQAWMQLVSNAVKFSPPDSSVGLGSSMRDGKVRLWVRDTGKGIPKKHQARVLERFHRVDESVDGAGLGLPIVAAIAHAHGGLLELKSTPGTGSLFTILIPLKASRS
ncbi:MAG: HAMP domain-containing histidine kinase [Demequinaceae bacterium]|nr:HAMP domain-containing histidine kinase [Demequinaceae bacterium]